MRRDHQAQGQACGIAVFVLALVLLRTAALVICVGVGGIASLVLREIAVGGIGAVSRCSRSRGGITGNRAMHHVRTPRRNAARQQRDGQHVTQNQVESRPHQFSLAVSRGLRQLRPVQDCNRQRVVRYLRARMVHSLAKILSRAGRRDGFCSRRPVNSGADSLQCPMSWR